MARDHILKVTLDDQELARLDELRPPERHGRLSFARSSRSRRGTTRLRLTPRPWRSSPGRRATARVASTIALERALRSEGAGAGDELDEILGKR
jgi:hypothetical protein